MWHNVYLKSNFTLFSNPHLQRNSVYIITIIEVFCRVFMFFMMIIQTFWRLSMSIMVIFDTLCPFNVNHDDYLNVLPCVYVYHDDN